MKSILYKWLAFLFPTILYSRNSFSQDGEDMLLKAFYEGRKRYKGFYIDIGAHHPYRFSNTAFFYKKGWKGINIEPTPSLIKAFKRIRKRDINLNIGISDSNSSLTFFQFNEPALNSFDKELSLSRENDKYKIISKKEIQVFTLRKVLSDYLPENQHIDFMNIDVEGLDLKVLESNDWSKFIPDYIFVEGNLNMENLFEDEIVHFLRQKNYTMVGRTKRTFLFKRNDLL